MSRHASRPRESQRAGSSFRCGGDTGISSQSCCWLLASFPAAWLSPQAVTLVPNLGLIDDNWHLDSTYKALRGIWIGRDVAFTHGPLFQWLSSIPARSMPISFGGLYATWNTVPLWCAIVFALRGVTLAAP